MSDRSSTFTFREALAGDLKRLEKRLETLCAGRLNSGAREGGHLRVLNLACGECFEAEMLERLMRRLHAPGGEAGSIEEWSLEFVGLDLREAEIARAADRCRSDKGTKFRFLNGDARRLTKAPELSGAFDIVFVRHQNYYLGGHAWHEIFAQGLEKLSPDGNLIITSYFDHEHELAKKAIEHVGGSLIADVVNGEARPLSPGKFVDKRLAMFRRKP